jgi:hypothetical protein
MAAFKLSKAISSPLAQKRLIMQCSLPPPLTDDEVTAALDGDAEPSVHEHLARCPSCTARLAEARQAERALKTSLRRWGCPTSQQLADYHLGRVSRDDDRKIMRHLEQCIRCTDELEELRLFLAADKKPRAAARPQPLVSARLSPGTLFARLVPQGPALAMRGAGREPLVAEADGTTIFLDIHPAADGQLMLQGQLVADDHDRWVGALVEVRQSAQLQATTAVDELGGFVCGPIRAGATELRITPHGGGMLVLADIELAS